MRKILICGIFLVLILGFANAAVDCIHQAYSNGPWVCNSDTVWCRQVSTSSSFNCSSYPPLSGSTPVCIPGSGYDSAIQVLMGIGYDGQRCRRKLYCDTRSDFGGWLCVKSDAGCATGIPPCVCSPGATKDEGSCGNCGHYHYVCNADGTAWINQGCQGSGVCSPGSTAPGNCNQTGYCAGAYLTCTSLCQWGTTCSKVPRVETSYGCNGIDDDCDGSCDEGIAPVQTGCVQIGECAGAVKSCGCGTWSACSKLPQVERCGIADYNKDYSCDGNVTFDARAQYSGGFECAKNWWWQSGSTISGLFYKPECTLGCKICKDNNVSFAIISSAGSSADANNVFAPALTQFRLDVFANSPNNCVVGYRYRLFFNDANRAIGWDENNLIIGSSSRLQYVEHVLPSPARTDFVSFGLKCMDINSQYKFFSQIVDQKSGRNVSGSVYTDAGWKESNVITVVDTPPTAPNVSMVKTGLGTWDCSVSGSLDPDVDCNLQKLTYFARIFKVVEGVTPDKGDFREALGGLYSLPFYEDANYCCEGMAGDGDKNSLVLNSCDAKKPVVHVCSDYGLSVLINSITVRDNNTVLVDLNALCTLSNNISSITFRNSAGNLVSGSIINPVPPVLCNSSWNSFFVQMDSNAEGNYSLDLNYSPIGCEKSVYFSVITSENPLAPRNAIPDSNIFAVLAALCAVSFILTRKRGK